VSAFGASAESVCRFTKKGSRVGVDGRLEWREWDTPDQQRRQAVSVVADIVQFLDGPTARAVEREDGDGPDDGAERELVGVGVDELDVTF
jgi:single-strand DNA-binding protein